MKNVVRQIVTSRRLKLSGSSAEVKSKTETDAKMRSSEESMHLSS